MWRRTVIDLTPLLDVILIMLFFVLMNASASVETAKAEADAGAAALASLQVENEALAQSNERLAGQLADVDFVDEHTRMITLTVEKNPDNDLRSVCLTPLHGTEKRFVLTWNNARVVRSALSAELTRLCVEEKEPQQLSLLIFRYDRNSIYQADYKLVSDVVRQVKSMAADIYSAEYDMMEVEQHG